MACACVGTPAGLGLPGWLETALTGAGATNCYDPAILGAIEGTLNANGFMPQRSTGCAIRARLYGGPLTEIFCGHPAVDFSIPYQTVDILAANGCDWAWIDHGTGPGDDGGGGGGGAAGGGGGGGGAFAYGLATILTPAAAGGTTVVTGLGFRPKLAIVYGVRTPTTQGLANAIRMGVDGGGSGVNGIGYSRALNPGSFAGTHVADGYQSGDGYSFLAMRTQGLNELMVLGYIQSFDADGFTVKWDFILAATGVRFYVLLLGGSIVHAKTIGFHPTSSPFSTTAIGFQPTALFGVHLGDVFSTVLLPGADSFSFGGATDLSCSQGTAASFSYQSFPPGGIVNARGYQRNTEWLAQIDTTGAVVRQTVLTSMDPLGFTVTNTGGGTYGVAAVNGCVMNMGMLTQPASPGAQAVPISMDRGQLVILYSFGHPASAAAVGDFLLAFGVGFADGAALQHAVWTGSRTGNAGELSNCIEDGTALGLVHTPTGDFASTLNTRVQLLPFTSQALNLNWTTVDGTARQWVYLVFGIDVATGPCGPPGIAPTTLTVDCAGGNLILTGTNLIPYTTLVVFDPSNNPVAYTVVSSTPTQIVLHLLVPFVNGTYCVEIS